MSQARKKLTVDGIVGPRDLGGGVVILDVEHTWIGVATVIAALGSATASIIAALNARTGKRIETGLTGVKIEEDEKPEEEP